MINNNLAYKCYCTKERLENIKIIQKKLNEQTKYDGFCKNKKKGKKFSIRFKMPELNKIRYEDLNKGIIEINSKEIDDFIIIKSNFIPTYNFASTIDDIEMNITDIIRGEDHIKNTMKHIMLLKTLQKKIPKFIHLPMIIDKENKPLSKRNNLNQLDYYKNNGFLPKAILNYLLKLGWAHKNIEIFSLEDMIKLFDIKNLNKSASKFDINKLNWINKFYIQNSENDTLKLYMKEIIKKNNYSKNIKNKINAIINMQKYRVSNLKEMIDNSEYFFKDIKYNLEEIDKKNITKVYENIKCIKNNWNIEKIKEIINNCGNENKLTLKYIADQLRLIFTGKKDPAPIFQILYYIGYRSVVNNLKKNIKKII